MRQGLPLGQVASLCLNLTLLGVCSCLQSLPLGMNSSLLQLSGHWQSPQGWMLHLLPRRQSQLGDEQDTLALLHLPPGIGHSHKRVVSPVWDCQGLFCEVLSPFRQQQNLLCLCPYPLCCPHPCLSPTVQLQGSSLVAAEVQDQSPQADCLGKASSAAVYY